jgi:hypothetical protein
MKLIKEITALGLDPAQLVQAGIRQEIVAFCCNELRLPFSHQGDNNVSGNGPSGQMSTVQAGPSSNALPNDSTDSVRRQGKQAKRSKSASAASQTAGSSQVGLAAEVPILPPFDPPSSALRSAPLLPPNVAAQEILMPPAMVSPDMEAMRRAALASMKRKKAAAEEKGQQSVTDDIATGDITEAEPIPTDAPLVDITSGPKAAKPFYHDIDAPPAQSLEDVDGIQDLMMEGDVSNSSISMDTITRSADPRESKRSKLLSYADNFSGDMDAPIGEVDLEAPMPSLELKSRPLAGGSDAGRSRSAHRKRPLAADLMELSSSASSPAPRSKPFLPSAMWQKMVVDCSDDEEEDSNEHGQVRQASTSFIAQVWKQMNTSEEDQVGSPRSNNPLPVGDNIAKAPTMTRSTSDAVLQKEQEIREMMAKIQELEKRRGQAPTDVKVIASVARKAVESEEAVSIIVGCHDTTSLDVLEVNELIC